MNDIARSRQLSWLLRHGAIEAGVPMSEAGWARVDDVCRFVGMSRDELDRAIVENTKARLVRDGDRVRAVQGHSAAGTGVTADALEASWERVYPSASLWHATSPEHVKAILREGLLPGERTHVHLADSSTSDRGKRFNRAVMLQVDPRGLAVFRADNGVFLVRHVPPSAIIGVEPS